MFFLLGHEQNIETMMLLSAACADGKPLAHKEDLQAAYQEFCRSVEPGLPIPAGESPCIVTGGQDVEQLVAIFSANSRLDDADYGLRIPSADRESERAMAAAVGTVQSSLAELRDIDYSLGLLFDLAIHTVFFAPASGAVGGTTSQALGVLWIDPRAAWTATDLIEFYVHELTHTLVFLDEWRYVHYLRPAAMARPENYALSAIRHVPRPIDKVVHSILVATEILLLRTRGHSGTEANALHPASDDLRSATLASIDSVEAVTGIEQIVAPRTLDLLGLARQGILVDRAA